MESKKDKRLEATVHHWVYNRHVTTTRLVQKLEMWVDPLYGLIGHRSEVPVQPNEQPNGQLNKLAEQRATWSSSWVWCPESWLSAVLS